MQQENGETEDGQQKQQAAPLRCPRCNSTDTKFRYYNNNDRGQPRHYCKTCRRYWTVGGSMRNIPFGGSSSRSNGKPVTKDSSSQLATKIEPLGSLSAPIHPATSYDLNDEISCLAAIKSLTQPHVGNGPFNTRNHFGVFSTAVDMNVLQDRNFQPNLALNQPSPKDLPNYGGNQSHPNWPMNPNLTQDFDNNFSFSAGNAGIWNNSNGNTNDPETARTSMNSNDWPHFSDYRGPP